MRKTVVKKTMMGSDSQNHAARGGILYSLLRVICTSKFPSRGMCPLSGTVQKKQNKTHKSHLKGEHEGNPGGPPTTLKALFPTDDPWGYLRK